MQITRHRVFRLPHISPAERATLEDPLVDIVQTWFIKSDRAFIAEHVVFRGTGWLLVFFGADDEILGFNSIGLSTVESEGRRWMVFDSGAYVRPGVRGSTRIAHRFGRRQIMRQRLRHPFTAFAFVGQAAGPVTYLRSATLFPVVHPRPGVPIPDTVTALVQTVMATRGLKPVVPADPWVVSLDEPAGLVQPERLKASAELRDDPDVRFYYERNPDFAQGAWLVVFVSLRWSYLLAAGVPWLRRRLSNRAR
jgi:hypothetical protein